MADTNGSTPFSTGEDIPDPDPIANELYQNSFDQSGDALLAELNARYDEKHSASENKTKVIKTPWTCLDEAIGGGLWPGLHFLVGSTGSGKTQFAMQIALGAAFAKIPTLYIALELGPLDLFARAAGIHQPQAGKWSELFQGDKRTPTEILDQLKGHPFHWLVAPPMGWSHEKLVPSVQALKKLYPKTPTVLVVIDFAQLMSGKERDLRERISKVAYSARALARDHNAVVLMISSTARDNYDFVNQADQQENGKKKKSPWERHPSTFVGMGKESGEIEYASDSVMVLVQEPWGGDRPPPGGTRFHLAIAKLRAGQPSWVELCFNGSLFTPLGSGPSTERESIPGFGR